MAFFIESGTGKRLTNPALADPNKFYIESGTGNRISGSELRGTSPLPSLDEVQADVKTGQAAIPSTEDAVQSFTNLSVALNKAVSLARGTRQDKTLDFLGGVIPAGTLPASSFASVISAFNRSSASFSGAAVSGALGFAQDERQAQLNQVEETRKRQQVLTDQRNDFLLQLAVVPNMDSKVIEGIQNLPEGTAIGDILSFSMPFIQEALKKNNKNIKETRVINDKIIVIDKDGNTEVVYDGATTSDVTPGFEDQFTDTQIAKGAKNAGVTIGEFKKFSIDDANDFINGGRIGEERLKNDIKQFITEAATAGASEEETLQDIRTLIATSAHDPDTFDGGKYKEGKGFFGKLFEAAKGQFGVGVPGVGGTNFNPFF